MTEHDEVRRLFDLAIGLPVGERDAALDRACGGDEGLKSRVLDMLSSEEGTLMDPSPPADPSSAGSKPTVGAGSREHAGQQIGRFKLLQQIGEGGFGSVFMAEQTEPVRRRVALKIIKLGMDTRQVVARFEQERQALAMMDHPNIARVLDAGATETGRPYFVMELVKGDRITEYCDKQNLSIEERLALFAQVCHAVQHAHSKGIIHRDIKPSNVIVSTQDGRPTAKVIDFGVAKATNATLTEKTLFTEHRQLIGTPEYMSPEQAEGSMDIDTRTDVYALGVLLYELLTSATPFDSKSLRSAAYGEIQRIIREVDPPRPSTRLSQDTDRLARVAASRRTEPRRLGTILRGELDWIVMKAMEKDRQRRYETANGLAMDIQRYLSGEAVVAAPPSRAYRLRKFVRQHRSGVVAAALVTTALVLGLAGTAYGLVRAERARAEEARQRIVAEEQGQIALKQANLALSSMQFVLTEVDAKLKTQPGTDDLRIAILKSVSSKWDDLEVEMTGGIRGEAIPTLMAMRQQIAMALYSLDRLEEADREFGKLYKMGQERIELKGPTDAARTNLAKIGLVWAPVKRRLAGDPKAVEDLLESSIDLVRETIRDPRPLPGSPSSNEISELLAAMLQDLGVEHLKQGRLPEAAAAFQEGLDLTANVLKSIRSEPGFSDLDDNQKDTKTASRQISHDKAALALASAQMRLGRTDEALVLYEEAVRTRREIFERRPAMLVLKRELADHLGVFSQSLLWIGDFDRANPLARESTELYEEILAADPQVADSKRRLSTALFRMGTLRDVQGNPDEAQRLFERSRSLREELYAASPDEKNAINLMLAEARVGNFDAARTLIDELGTSPHFNGERHMERARALTQLSRHAEGDRRSRLRDEALAALERAVNEGYSDPFRVSHEQDLEPLHGTERFDSVVARLQSAQGEVGAAD